MSAPIYNVLTEFTSLDEDEADSTSSTPFWVIAVVQLAYPLSFSRSTMSSATVDSGDGVRTRGKTLVITSDCKTLSVNNNKESHLKSLQAQLLNSRNYLTEILPDDWILAWILNDETKAQDLISRIQSGDTSNNWDDGLKFVGRVDSVHKDMIRNESMHTVHYSLTATAFTPLDASIFYEIALAEAAKQQSLTWMAKIGLDINKIFEQSSNGAGVKDNVHIIIPELLEILLGRGLPSDVDSGKQDGLEATYGSVSSTNIDGTDSCNPQEAPYAYLVPKEVGDLLGKSSNQPSKAGGILAYTDLLELLFGVQTYSNTNANTSPWLKFTPDINNGPDTSLQHQYTGTPMLGAFWPLLPELNNTPFWNVLEQFLNAPVNEMFTALRVNNQGNVVPTMILRQIPFTTQTFAQQQQQTQSISDPTNTSNDDNAPIPYTEFLNLPRWHLAPQLIKQVSIGRSNQSRVNFVHVYGQNNYGRNMTLTQQIAVNRPIQDQIDIQRSGMKAYSTTVACDVVNQAGKAPLKWMRLVADRLMGNQLTLNGQIVSEGISAPICEGDNLEFDGVVFHIEAVRHQCSIDADGKRSFVTSLSLSNGLTATPDANSYSSNPDLKLYAGIQLSDQTNYDPGITSDTRLPETPDNAPDSNAESDNTPSNGPINPVKPSN